MKNIKKQERGFALTQLLLALAISSVIAATVVYSYVEHSKTQSYQLASSLVTKNSELSLQQKVIGQNTVQNATLNGYNIDTVDGVSTVTNIDKKACNAISSNLKAKGSVTSDCSDSNATNSVEFTPSGSISVSKNLAVNFEAGVPEVGASNTLSAPNLKGNLNVDSLVSTVNAPTTGGSFSSSGGTLGAPVALSGNTGSLTNGSTVGASGVSAPPVVYTGSGTINQPPAPTPSAPPSSIVQSCSLFDNSVDAGQGYNNDSGYPQITKGATSIACSYSVHFLYWNEPSDPSQVGPSFTLYGMPNGSTITWSSSNCPSIITSIAGVNVSGCIPNTVNISAQIMNSGGVTFSGSATAVLTLPDGTKYTYNYQGNSYRMHGPN